MSNPITEESYFLNEKPWDFQLKEVIKAYHKGIITYVECVIKQNEIIGQALMKGIPFEKINEFIAQ